MTPELEGPSHLANLSILAIGTSFFHSHLFDRRNITLADWWLQFIAMALGFKAGAFTTVRICAAVVSLSARRD